MVSVGIRPFLTMVGALVLAACAARDTDADPCEDITCPRGEVCREGVCEGREDDAAVEADGGGEGGARGDATSPPDPDEGVAGDLGAPDVGPAGDLGASDAHIAADGQVVTPDAEVPELDAGAPCEPGIVEDCGRTQGRCRAGTRVCSAEGRWGPCNGEIPPQDEVCNAADDDCNGVVDDGFEVGVACDGVGACGAGVVECRNEVLTRCSTDPGGSRDGSGAETCDSADDDCDGRTDEGFPVGQACAGGCGPGRNECNAMGGVVCSTDPGGSMSIAMPEVCNGFDDDCSGEVDDGFPLGSPCDGVGACGAGVVECNDAGGTRCSSDAGGSVTQAVAEACNGRDDDCDERLDEGFAVGQPCQGAGACGPGTTECSAAGAVICSTDPGGSESEVGPGGGGVGAACAAQGICAAGVFECSAEGRLVCSTRLGGSAQQARAERCDRADDDCDGRVDEAFPTLGMACEGRGGCGRGVGECGPAGAAICSTETGGSADQSAPDVCEGTDEDCDGRIDEGAACGGDTCETAPGLDLTGTLGGTTGGLADDYGNASCLGALPGLDFVARFETQAANVAYAIGVAPLDPAFDLAFFVSGDCARLSTCVAGGQGNLNGPGRPEGRRVSLPRADSFYIAVDSTSPGAGGPFVLTARPFAEGESCAAPIRLDVPARFAGTTEFRVSDLFGNLCPPTGGANTGGADQVFQLVPPRGGLLRVTVTPGATMNPAPRMLVGLSTVCGEGFHGACVGGSALPGNGTVQTFSAPVEAGVTYYLAIDQLANPGGPFLLEVDLE